MSDTYIIIAFLTLSLSATAILPAIGIILVCKLKRLKPKYAHIALTSTALGFTFPSFVYFLFSVAEHITYRLILRKCTIDTAKPWFCHCFDLVFTNATLHSLVISGLLAYMFLHILLTVEPDALSHSAKN